jgi:hypothetical protein
MQNDDSIFGLLYQWVKGTVSQAVRDGLVEGFSDALQIPQRQDDEDDVDPERTGQAQQQKRGRGRPPKLHGPQRPQLPGGHQQ